MSHGSAACKGRSKRAKQSLPDSPTTSEPSDNGFAALSEPEQGASCDEDATHDDEVEDVGEQLDNNPAQEGLTDDLLDADSSQDTLNDDPVRITMANPFGQSWKGVYLLIPGHLRRSWKCSSVGDLWVLPDSFR